VPAAQSDFGVEQFLAVNELLRGALLRTRVQLNLNRLIACVLLESAQVPARLLYRLAEDRLVKEGTREVIVLGLLVRYCAVRLVLLKVFVFRIR